MISKNGLTRDCRDIEGKREREKGRKEESKEGRKEGRKLAWRERIVGDCDRIWIACLHVRSFVWMGGGGKGWIRNG